EEGGRGGQGQAERRPRRVPRPAATAAARRAGQLPPLRRRPQGPGRLTGPGARAGGCPVRRGGRRGRYGERRPGDGPGPVGPGPGGGDRERWSARQDRRRHVRRVRAVRSSDPRRPPRGVALRDAVRGMQERRAVRPTLIARRLLLPAVAVLVVVVDQITKTWA